MNKISVNTFQIIVIYILNSLYRNDKYLKCKPKKMWMLLFILNYKILFIFMVITNKLKK